MFISSSKPTFTAPVRKPKAVPQKQEKISPPFKERAVTSAIVGASVGTMVGERVGEVSLIGAVSYAGYAIGSMVGQDQLGGIVGAVAGAGAGYFLEKKVPIGKTAGGAAGFVSGGIVGGITGTLIAGASSILNLDLFQ
jgi:hypothetical protein